MDYIIGEDEKGKFVKFEKDGAQATIRFDATNAAEHIDKERQLELAYQAERTYDIYRNGNTLVRRFPGYQQATLEVPATDYRVPFFIPQSAINAYPSGCTLTQNPTSNAGVILN